MGRAEDMEAEAIMLMSRAEEIQLGKNLGLHPETKPAPAAKQKEAKAKAKKKDEGATDADILGIEGTPMDPTEISEAEIRSAAKRRRGGQKMKKQKKHKKE